MKTISVVLTFLAFLNLFADEPVSPYDIPGKSEMEVCSCLEKDGDKYSVYLSSLEPFFITVTIANFGEENLNNVYVDAPYSSICFHYLSETAQISKRNSFSQDHNWKKVEDNDSEEISKMFPFTNYMVSNVLKPCENELSDCENITIRYQFAGENECIKPIYIPLGVAVINDERNVPYSANGGVEIKLSVEWGDVKDSSCYVAPQDQCGGHNFTRPEENSDEDGTKDADIVENTDSENKKTDGCSVLIL